MANEQCQKNGIVFGFFNGVQNTLLQAEGARRKLEDIYGPTTPDGEPITYELFYNDTEGFADFVETFEQRLQEHGGLLAGRFELFFSATKGEGRWWNTLISAVPMAGDVLGGFFDLFRAAVIRKLTSDLGDPDSVKVAERHKAQIGQWVSRQKGLLFMAHSQGNLFVNLAYAQALALTDAEQPLSESEEEDERRKGWDRVDFVGKGMGGYRSCSWGRYPLEGWAEPVFGQECTFDRVPLHYRFEVGSRIDELVAYGAPTNGTLVRLNTVTRSSAALLVGGSDASGRFIGFMSGINPLWILETQDRREWSEPYVLKEGEWMNQDAYQNWLAAWEAHQTSELRHLERYQEEREAYEACDCANK